MNNRLIKMAVTAAAFCAVAAGGCAQQRTKLWNGKDFSGWKLYVPDPAVDVHKVWSVKDGVIHCTGKPNGYIRTEADYDNYMLNLEWRWVEELPAGGRRNSGVLVHTSGPDKVWPRSIECQLMADNAGDFWLIGGTSIMVDGQRIASLPKPTRSPKKNAVSEKPIGQWNTYEIFCKADTVRCYVNGVLQNEGAGASETSGKICLQSEGAPIEFRNIYIERLK